MSELKYDGLDRVVRAHISECNGELPRLSFEKELERQRLAGECCADTIQKETDRLTLGSMKELRSKLIAGTAQERFERLYLTGWDSAAEKGDWSEMYSARALLDRELGFDQKLASMTKDETWRHIMKPRAVVFSKSPTFCIVDDRRNNELLL